MYFHMGFMIMMKATFTYIYQLFSSYRLDFQIAMEKFQLDYDSSGKYVTIEYIGPHYPLKLLRTSSM